MNSKIGVISEVIVLAFNILIFMKMTVLKKDNLVTRLIMYIGAAIILGIFFVCTYTGILPEVLGSFVCVTIPTFTLFFILSKYKDFRFFVTFCFLDTVTFVITFFSRMVGIISDEISTEVISAVVVCLLMFAIYLGGSPYFKRYRELLTNVNDGWGIMALSAFLIYALLIFAATYPKPLAERIDYFPVYAFLAVTILSFYTVFILSLLQKKKLADLNTQLINEQKWHKIAYCDALTGMKNRMAYMEQINEFERIAEKTDIIHVVMIDIDNFKKINDTLGHHIGDLTLKNAAKLIDSVFSEDNYSTFRIGGDEFAVIANGISAESLERKIASLRDSEFDSDVGCSFSVGYSTADFEQKNAMENAFIRADSAMYEEKLKAKSV